jgi:hypothetical protein
VVNSLLTQSYVSAGGEASLNLVSVPYSGSCSRTKPDDKRRLGFTALTSPNKPISTGISDARFIAT